MAVLDQLTLASATPKRDTTPAGRFRRRLLDAVDLQIEIAKADGAGTELKRTRRRWVKNEAGGKELCSVPVRLRRWWWKDDAGKTYLSLRHGARLLEIAPGKQAIEVGAVEDLPAKLTVLREAVRSGELDGCMTSARQPRDVRKSGKAPAAAARPTPAKA